MKNENEELRKAIYSLLNSMFPEVIIKKVERGEELSKEETEIVLKFIHDETTNNKRVAKEALPKRREIGGLDYPQPGLLGLLHSAAPVGT